MARILVDTSAWIEFYHPKGATWVKLARTAGDPALHLQTGSDGISSWA